MGELEVGDADLATNIKFQVAPFDAFGTGMWAIVHLLLQVGAFEHGCPDIGKVGRDVIRGSR